MPLGALVILPLPLTAALTLKLMGILVKVAVTCLSVFIVNVHGAVPLQAPLHPLKLKPSLGVVLNATFESLSNYPVHIELHLIPPGMLVTLPSPATVI